MKLLLTLLILIFPIYAQARELPCRKAHCIRTSTVNFDGGLGATDTRSQTAFDTIDDFLDTDTLVALLCSQAKMNCVYDTHADCPDSGRCVVYEDNLWKQYANGVLQAQWPIEAAEYHLLLDDGVGEFKLLLDDGVGGYFLVIK